jgi:hypothetical protein
MSTFFGTCEACGKPVTDAEGRPAYPVEGWEVGRDGGGANAIRNRRRLPGRVRHEVCLPNLKVNENQESLL